VETYIEQDPLPLKSTLPWAWEDLPTNTESPVETREQSQVDALLLPVQPVEPNSEDTSPPGSSTPLSSESLTQTAPQSVLQTDASAAQHAPPASSAMSADQTTSAEAVLHEPQEDFVVLFGSAAGSLALENGDMDEVSSVDVEAGSSMASSTIATPLDGASTSADMAGNGQDESQTTSREPEQQHPNEGEVVKGPQRNCFMARVANRLHLMWQRTKEFLAGQSRFD
jgi:hypothetical protein